jgi:hypothetical protein
VTVVASLRKELKTAMRRIYPALPEECVESALEHALQPKAVGHASSLPLDRRAHLAVLAHARHDHSPYEALIGKCPQGTWYRLWARGQSEKAVRKALERWRALTPEGVRA